MNNSRIFFAVLCAAGVVAISIGAALEIRRFRRGEILSPRQFRARMVSAAIWLAILAANFYAVTALWPDLKYLAPGKLSPQSKEQVRLFVYVMGGSFGLIFIALGLLLFDLRHISRERQLQRAKFKADIAELAQQSKQREQA